VSHAKNIAEKLGSATREGRNWRCRCPECGGHTLYLRDGHDKLLVYCWGGCPASAVLVELRKRGLLDYCNDRPVHPNPPQRRHSNSDNISRVALANHIWTETVDPRDTLVKCYFAARGLTFPHRGEEAIRFHPHCPFKG
jgi:hypothetical protein